MVSTARYMVLVYYEYPLVSDPCLVHFLLMLIRFLNFFEINLPTYSDFLYPLIYEELVSSQKILNSLVKIPTDFIPAQL